MRLVFLSVFFYLIESYRDDFSVIGNADAENR